MDKSDLAANFSMHCWSISERPGTYTSPHMSDGADSPTCSTGAGAIRGGRRERRHACHLHETVELPYRGTADRWLCCSRRRRSLVTTDSAEVKTLWELLCQLSAVMLVKYGVNECENGLRMLDLVHSVMININQSLV